jgi:hypothetical protein
MNMNRFRKIVGFTVIALGINSAFAAGGPALDVQVEQQTQGFLNALAQGGGTPLEQLSPKDARAVLTGAQAGATLPAAEISEKPLGLMASH